MGVERQWSGHASGPHARLAGVRTFTLLGALAGVAGWMWTHDIRALAVVLLAAAALLALALAAPAHAAEPVRAHGFTFLGKPALPPDFPHFPYADPAAPKGGDLALSSVGAYDNFNPFVLRGAAEGAVVGPWVPLPGGATDPAEPLGPHEHFELSTVRGVQRGCLRLRDPRPHLHGRRAAMAHPAGDRRIDRQHRIDAIVDPRVDALRGKMVCVENKKWSKDYLDPSKRSIANAVQVFFKDGTSTTGILWRHASGVFTVKAGEDEYGISLTRRSWKLPFADLMAHCDALIAGQVRGRAVVCF